MYLRELLIKIGVTLTIIFIVSYGAYRIYPLVAGPSIKIYEPARGEKANSNMIIIKGNAKRVSELKIYDREIFISPEGDFETYILKDEFWTEIIITGTDKYGNKKEVKTFVQ